MKHRTN
ncbi:unnamed protein product [Acanthoscelides obtectus]|nr:unnamed protein product [Acanthoscelides obtectus]CAK1680527.1 hypothetical protein AOBTE_LOCUS32728 [Acanthoscelides obtectus]